MSSTDEILARADKALSITTSEDKHASLRAITELMKSFELIARKVAHGDATWDAARAWALANEAPFRAARAALQAWELEKAELFYHGGEEEAERALARRSQRAFARELFRGTPADEMLSSFDDEEIDEEFRAEAERIAIDAPDWVPRGHRWWRWPKET